MAFLDNGDRAALRRAAEAVREREETNRRLCKRKIEIYCRDATRLLGSKKALRDCLRVEKGGVISRLASSESQAKALSALQALDGVSEMVFMSFFHTVYQQFRAHSEPLPNPKEIMDMQKLLFGRRFIPTSDNNIAMLAYTLGLLDETDLDIFEKEKGPFHPAQKEEMPSPERVENTTALLELRLEGAAVSLEAFTAQFRDPLSLQNTSEWRENLKDCFQEICKAHNANPRYIQPWLERRGCAHMKSELENSALLFSEEEKPGARIPGRKWILAFCLHMELGENETDRLLRRCGYVPLGFKPWEEGLRYLLRNPGKNFRESLDHREDVFAFLMDCDLQPPSTLFAAFPYLATRPGKDDRRLFASLLLDCLAQVHLQTEGDYLAEFCQEWQQENPDLLDIFLPKEGCVNLKDQLLGILCLPVRGKLPKEGRASEDYQRAAESVKNWQKGWKAAEPPFPGARVLWTLPPEEGFPCRGMKLYALLLYVVYTGHLPMRDFQFPAGFPCRPGHWPLGEPLRFEALEEADVCQRMAASVLKSLKEK